MEILLSALLKISINYLIVFISAFLLSPVFQFENIVLFFGIFIGAIAAVELLRFVVEAHLRGRETITMLDSADSVATISDSLHNDFCANLRKPFNNLFNRDHILSLFINSISILLYFALPFSGLGINHPAIAMALSFLIAIPLSLFLTVLANLMANALNNRVFSHLENTENPHFRPLVDSWKITEKSLKFDVKNSEFCSLFGFKDLSVESLANIIFFVDLDKRDKMIKVLQRVKAPQAAATLARFLELYPTTHGMAVSALIKSQDRALEPLIKLLKTEDKLVKRSAMNALSGINTPQAVSALVEMLNDKNVEIKRSAIWDLNENNSHWTEGPSGERARQILLRSLGSCHVEERAFSAWALGMIKDKKAAMQLKELLSDNHHEVRENAVFALGELREVMVQADIEKSLNDSDQLVRNSALVALRKINPQRAAEHIKNNG